MMDKNTPVPFGYKMGWLAMRSTDRDAIVRHLQLSDPIEADWQKGIDVIYRDAYNLVKLVVGSRSKVFISPPVSG
jgi:hypothetical protein